MAEVKFLNDLISCFEKLPGVGKKTASRYAYYIIEKYSKNDIEEVCNILKSTFNSIHKCNKCGMITTKDRCEICDDDNRTHDVLLIVKDIKDLISIEKTNQYKGVYFVLDGLISDFNVLKNNENKFVKLENIIKNSNIKEVIIGVPLTPQGEITTTFLKQIISKYDVEVYRIGYGLPAGSDLEYADEITIKKAFEYKIQI